MHLFYIHHEHVLYIVYFFTTAQSLFLDIFVSCYFFKTQTISNLSEQNLALLMLLFFVKQNLSQNFPLHWKKQTQVQAGRIHHNIFFLSNNMTHDMQERVKLRRFVASVYKSSEQTDVLLLEPFCQPPLAPLGGAVCKLLSSDAVL